MSFVLAFALIAGTVVADPAAKHPKSDDGHAATVTWRVLLADWEDDGAFAKTAAFFEKHRLTGKIALFTSENHMPSTLSRMRELMPVLARRIAFFREKGYEVGVNHLSTLGHLEENFDTSVEPDVPGATFWTTIDGATSRCRCPNDPVWREKFVRPLYRMLAVAKPDFIWTDDEFRLTNHASKDGRAKGLGCFCPVCMARIRERLGFVGERKDLPAFFADGEKGIERRMAMMQLNREAIAELLAYVRESVHAVDPSIVIGIMDTNNPWHGCPYPEWYRAVAPTGGERVYWRPGGGFYDETRPEEMFGKANTLGFLAANIPDGVTALESEVESFNYRRIDKSDHMTATEALLYIAAGTRGTAWNILPAVYGEDYSVFDRTAQRMEALRAKCDALVEAAGRARPIGVSSGYGRNDRVGVCPRGDWFGRDPDEGGAFHGTDLQKIGIPIAYRDEDAVVIAPYATCVYAASRETLEKWLSKGLYLTAGSLKAFIARGYGEDVGFVPAGTEDIGILERNLDHPLNAGYVGYIRDGRQSFWPEKATFLKPLAGAQPVTSAVDIRGRSVAPCLAGAFENRRGGRVYVAGYVPYRVQTFSPACARMKRIFDWLSHGALPGWVASYHRIALWVRGERTVALLNMSMGEAEEPEVVLRGAAWSHGIREVGEKGASVLKGVLEGDMTRYRLPNIPAWSVRVYAPVK